jgi:putative two-component system response regulator
MDTCKGRIIVADDSFTSNMITKNLLVKQGYDVHVAFDGEEALNLIGTLNPDLIILDIMMPNVSGLDVCKIVKSNEKTRFIPVIILTASDSREDKNYAISAGANDYLNKPYDKTELKLKVDALVKLKNAIDEMESASNIILALAKAVEAKDNYTEGHGERVSLYSSKIAKRLNLQEQQIKNIITAGILHDVGKIGIPDVILNKPGKVTDREYDLIKQHPIIGEEICNPIKSFSNIKKIVRHHHEKLNGTGYPDGLSGDSINIETRIIAVADIYDALTSSRFYRQPVDEEAALQFLDEYVLKGELDKEVVDTLRSIILTI